MPYTKDVAGVRYGPSDDVIIKSTAKPGEPYSTTKDLESLQDKYKDKK